MIEVIETVIGICIGCLTVISLVAGIIVKLFKNSKNKKLAETAKMAEEIGKFAEAAINEIENIDIKTQSNQVQHIKTGMQKKLEVMEAIEEFCKQKGILFDRKYWSEKVDKIVEQMNSENGVKQ